MRIIAKRTLREYWEQHESSRAVLESWHQLVSSMIWESPNDVTQAFPKSSILSGDRIVFRIKGNTYRLVVKVDYTFRLVFIRFIGTHAEYDKIDAKTI